MRSSRSKHSLSPVIIGAMFLVLLGGCAGTEEKNEPTTIPSDGTSAAMETTRNEKNEDAGMKNDDGNNEDSATEDDGTGSPVGSSSSSSKSSVPSSQAATLPKRHYADGTFAAAGSYTAPSGGETINVSLTLKNDIVVEGSVQGKATNGRSIQYQAAFTAGFQQAVVGKSIDSLNLDVVNGSSLTPMGFMDALAKIKAEAAMKA